MFLMRNCASAGRYARTSWAFWKAVKLVARKLEEDESIIYWTGNRPPLVPPSSPLLLGQEVSTWRDLPRDTKKVMGKLVPSLGLEDVEPLLTNKWCNNFTLKLILKSCGVADAVTISDSGCVRPIPRIMENDVLARLLISHGMRVCDAFKLRAIHLPNYVVDVQIFREKHPTWAAQIAAAPFILLQLNSGNTHWATVRAPQVGPIEVYESCKGCSDIQLVKLFV